MSVKTPKKDFLILYGSQTGQAEAISEEIFDRAHKEGFNCVRYCLSQTEKKVLNIHFFVVYMLSDQIFNPQSKLIIMNKKDISS